MKSHEFRSDPKMQHYVVALAGAPKAASVCLRLGSSATVQVIAQLIDLGGKAFERCGFVEAESFFALDELRDRRLDRVRSPASCTIARTSRRGVHGLRGDQLHAVGFKEGAQRFD